MTDTSNPGKAAPMSDNTAQATYWNEGAGPTWAALQADLDRQLAPLGAAAQAALAPQPGERILDVGCGCGATSLDLAAAVGPSGAVTGLDISRPMLEIARGRSKDLGNVSFIEADAQTYAFEPGAYDAIFSRFGVMFFADPVAAFANLRRALKPGGRLAFVCWRPPGENPIMTLPMAAAAKVVEPPPPGDPLAPGPFAFADSGRVLQILTDAGFPEVAITPHDDRIGAGDLETSLGVSLRVGPLGGVLRENPDKRDAAIAAVRQALAPFAGPDGVRLGAAVWIVTARV